MMLKRLIGALTFGLFVGLISIMWNYQGIVRVAIGVIAGASLVVSARLFVEAKGRPLYLVDEMRVPSQAAQLPRSRARVEQAAVRSNIA